MKLLTAVLFLSFVLFAVATPDSCPEYCKYKSNYNSVPANIRVRKDIRCLTEQEWKNFADACQVLHKRGVFDKFNHIHIKYFAAIHDTAQFFPWHRWFIFLFENELRSVHPNITIPYWDGTNEFSAPGLSEVFNAERFGSMGDPEDDYCVRDGLVANWRHLHPNETCLKRNFGPNGRYSVGLWHSPEWITHLFQTDLDYDDFREGVEFSIHALMHGNVGGYEGDLRWPWGVNDALFFLLHGNMDRIWAKWQAQSKRNLNDYFGPKRDFTTNFTSNDASVNDMLEGYNITVKHLLHYNSELLPYTYDELLGNEGDNRDLTIAEQRLSLLPPYMLEKYFPRLLYGKPSKYHIDFAPPCWPQKGFPMPPVTQMSPQTLLERGFNAVRAMRVQADSNSLVERLNQENYLSPYVQ